MSESTDRKASMKGVILQLGFWAVTVLLAFCAAYLCPQALFGITSLAGAIGFLVSWTMSSIVVYFAFGWVISNTLLRAPEIRSAGRLWKSAWIIAGYFSGLLLLRWMLPGTVLMSTVGAMEFAGFTMMIFWGVHSVGVLMGWVTKPLRTWFPS